jgi:hypothetical protein
MLTVQLEDARESLEKLGISDVRSNTMHVASDASTTFLRAEILHVPSSHRADHDVSSASGLTDGALPPLASYDLPAFVTPHSLAVASVWTGVVSAIFLFGLSIIVVFDARLLNVAKSALGSALLIVIFLFAGIAFVMATRMAHLAARSINRDNA